MTRYLSLVFIIMILIGCTNNDPIIKGRYLAYPNENLNNINLELNLFQNEDVQYRYSKRLSKDGSFSVRIKQRGEYYLLIAIKGHTFPDWEKPRISNELLPYFYNFEDSQIIKLEDLYLCDVIKVVSPQKNQKYTDELLSFKWEKIPFADFYDIGISKMLENGESELIISTHHITSNNITYSRIQDLSIVDGKLDFNSILSSDSFNRHYKPIEKGKYKFVVVAYKALHKRKDFLELSENSGKTYFFVQ